jgi:hypothetical protein
MMKPPGAFFGGVGRERAVSVAARRGLAVAVGAARWTTGESTGAGSGVAVDGAVVALSGGIGTRAMAVSAGACSGGAQAATAIVTTRMADSGRMGAPAWQW